MTATLDRAAVEQFRSLVAQRLGLNFDESKQDFLEDVLRQRMESTGCARFWSYQQLFFSTNELRMLVDQLTVGETYFFRYADHFRLFPEVLVTDRHLVDEAPLFWQRDAFDVVFCRNVTMYFTLEAVRSVMARIAQSVTSGGFLFLGHAETLRGISHDFHLRHTHETFYYQRRDA